MPCLMLAEENAAKRRMNRGRYVANSWRLAPGYMYLIGRGST